MSDPVRDDRRLARGELGREATSVAASWCQSEPADTWCAAGLACQYCRDCGVRQYPPRPLCRGCLGDSLGWYRERGAAELLSMTRLHVSMHAFYRDGAPWPVGLVRLVEDICVYVFLEEADLRIGDELVLYQVPDLIGEAVAVAVRPGEYAEAQAGELAARLSCKNKVI